MTNTSNKYLLDPAVKPVYRGLFGAVALIFVIVGLIGNLFVCLAIARIRRFRSTINLLIANLATADILQCLNIISMFVTLVKGEWVFGTFLCHVNAFLMIGLVTASVYSLVAIGINRYVIIYHSEKYPTIFSRKQTKLMMAAVWIVAAASASPPFFGWGVYAFAPRRGFCILDFSTSASYVITMSTTILLLPFLVIMLAYLKIFQAISKSKQRIRKIQPNIEEKESSSQQSTSSRRLKNQRLEAFSLSIMLFVVTFLFVLIYLPTMVFNFLAMIGKETTQVGIDLGFVLVALSNHVINPFVYGIMNKNYRTSVKLVIKNCLR